MSVAFIAPGIAENWKKACGYPQSRTTKSNDYTMNRESYALPLVSLRP